MTLERLDPAKHGDSLWRETGGLDKTELWRWMPDGPFETRAEFDSVLQAKSVSQDPLFYALCVNGEALGHASYMRMEPKHRVIEVGGIMYGPSLQRTREATEAMYLMAKRAFEELNVRRYEWKCNALNQPSRSAALRLGFTFEGIFRQHMIIKGVNRDTAWFSMLDSEWPARKAAFQRWLAPSNFDGKGRQLNSLTLYWYTSTIMAGGKKMHTSLNTHAPRFRGAGTQTADTRTSTGGIDVSHIQVGGGAVGLFFSVGIVLIFIWGVPALRWLPLGAVATGAVISLVLRIIHEHKPIRPFISLQK